MIASSTECDAFIRIRGDAFRTCNIHKGPVVRRLGVRHLQQIGWPPAFPLDRGNSRSTLEYHCPLRFPKTCLFVALANNGFRFAGFEPAINSVLRTKCVQFLRGGTAPGDIEIGSDTAAHKMANTEATFC